MRKFVIIFGAAGNLGRGVTNSLVKKQYDRFTLLDFDISILDVEPQNVTAARINDLSIEENVRQAFDMFTTDRESEYFIYSTIGGFAGGNEICDTHYEEWLTMQNLNLNISFLIAKYAFKLVKNSYGGSICFTSAMTSIKPEVSKASYGTSKSGLNYLVKALSLEGQKYNFSANAVAPIALDTEENREWVTDEAILTKPEDIGEFVHLLFKNYKKQSGNVFEFPREIKL